MKSLLYLNKYLFKYKWHLFLGFLFIIISNFFKVKMPQIIQDTIDEIEIIMNQHTQIEQSILIDKGLLFSGFFVLLSLGYGVFLFFTRQTIIVMSRRIEFDLKNEIYQQYQALTRSFYKRNNTGDLMNRISEDVSKVRMYLGPAIMYTSNLIVLFVFVIYEMLMANVTLTLYVLLPLPIMSITIYYVSSLINKKSELQQQQQSTLSTFVQEAFSGIRVIKAYNRQANSLDRFVKETETYKSRNLKTVKIESIFMPSIILLIGLSTILTIFIGGMQQIQDASVTNGTIAQFVIYVNLLTWPFASVGWVTSLVQRAAASQKRINEFLAEVPDVKNHSEESPDFSGPIVFDQVSFTYPDSGIQALKNFNITIQPGTSLAIIGRTGSGKSTIANLLFRLYDIENGSININGRSIKSLNLNKLRNSIGYVPQEVFLFSDTISNNIKFGVDDKNQSFIEDAAKQAQVHENIIDFPNQYNTVLGERGINLSGGQKQRISIARALIKDPDLLIFDDCLSAVDTQTEDAILHNLNEIRKNKTTIIISHRVSSVKDCDHIIYLEEGNSVEEGTHKKLLQKKGKYSELYEKQLLEEQKIV